MKHHVLLFAFQHIALAKVLLIETEEKSLSRSVGYILNTFISCVSNSIRHDAQVVADAGADAIADTDEQMNSY